MKKFTTPLLQRIVMFFGGLYIALLGLYDPVKSISFILGQVDDFERRRRSKQNG
jgi:hypothetical protein